jgi:lipoate-protein ligase A
MIYLESDQTDPYFNLAMEEFVFEHMDRSKQYFMLWRNENTIVVGKYQNTAEEINQEFVEKHGIRVARRLSGGGAVYHDKGNLNFTFVVNQEANWDFDFKVFILPVVQALAKLGVQAEFNGRNDITIDGQKFSGNSQYARRGRLLHHGCMMLDSNLTNVADALQVKEAKFVSKSVKSVRSRVTTINAHAPAPISMALFMDTLRGCILAGDEQLERYELTPEDLSVIRRLREEKYATWDWNYGVSPPYDMRREVKLPAGLVTAYLQAEQGRIKAVRFYGDFFGNGEIRELEQSMAGLPLDGNLEKALQRLNIGYYMSGIDAAALAALLK